MRANVLHDPALVEQAGQFAWLSINSDNPANATFSDMFRVEGVPAFLVINPGKQNVALTWYGTATAPELVKVLEDGKRAVAGGGSGSDAMLARADQLNGERKFREAAEAYKHALDTADLRWPRRSRSIESLVTAYSLAQDRKHCAGVAVQYAPAMPRDRSFVNTVSTGLDCSDPGAGDVAQVEKLAEEGVKLPGVLADDVSGLYLNLMSMYEREKNQTEATRTGEAWVHYLQGEIDKAGTAEARIGLDLQLASAATRLKRPELALPELQRAERELPRDYNPPLAQAKLYDAMQRYDDALAACDRAMAKASGNGKLPVYIVRGRVLEHQGDKPAARKMYSAAIEYANGLPGLTAKEMVLMFEKSRAALDKADHPGRP